MKRYGEVEHGKLKKQIKKHKQKNEDENGQLFIYAI